MNTNLLNCAAMSAFRSCCIFNALEKEGTLRKISSGELFENSGALQFLGTICMAANASMMENAKEIFDTDASHPIAILDGLSLSFVSRVIAERDKGKSKAEAIQLSKESVLDNFGVWAGNCVLDAVSRNNAWREIKDRGSAFGVLSTIQDKVAGSSALSIIGRSTNNAVKRSVLTNKLTNAFRKYSQLIEEYCKESRHVLAPEEDKYNLKALIGNGLSTDISSGDTLLLSCAQASSKCLEMVMSEYLSDDSYQTLMLAMEVLASHANAAIARSIVVGRIESSINVSRKAILEEFNKCKHILGESSVVKSIEENMEFHFQISDEYILNTNTKALLSSECRAFPFYKLIEGIPEYKSILRKRCDDFGFVNGKNIFSKEATKAIAKAKDDVDICDIEGVTKKMTNILGEDLGAAVSFYKDTVEKAVNLFPSNDLLKGT